MDDAGGCIGSIIVLFLVMVACEGAANQIGTQVGAVAGPFIILLMFALVVMAVVGVVAGCAILIEKRHKERRQAQEGEKKRKSAQELERTILKAEREIRAHYEKVGRQDRAAQDHILQRVREAFRGKIYLSDPDGDKNLAPTFSWRGAPEVKGKIYLYRGGQALYQSVRELRENIDQEGLLATRSLARSGAFVDRSGSGAERTFYLYWAIPHEGKKPAIVLNGETTTGFAREDLLGGYELTTIPYTMFLSGGFKAERISVPAHRNLADREEEEITTALRLKELARQRAKLSGEEETESTVEAAARRALDEAKKASREETEVAEVIRDINESDLSDTAKEHAIANFRANLNLPGGLTLNEEDWDYEE